MEIKITSMTPEELLAYALAGLVEKREKIRANIEEVQIAMVGLMVQGNKGGSRLTKQIAVMKKVQTQAKSATSASSSATAPKQKHQMSEAGRQRIRDAQKRRWAGKTGKAAVKKTATKKTAVKKAVGKKKGKTAVPLPPYESISEVIKSVSSPTPAVGGITDTN